MIRDFTTLALMMLIGTLPSLGCWTSSDEELPRAATVTAHAEDARPNSPDAAHSSDPPAPGPASDDHAAQVVPAPQDKDPPSVAARFANDAPLADGDWFQGWAAPRVAIVVTGMQQGYIEPCGCTGLANAKGGLMRRHTLLGQLQQRGWNVVPVDVGELVRRLGRQSEIKYQRSIDALRAMNYRALAFGPADLRLSTGELHAAVADAEEHGLFVSANVGLFDFDEQLIPALRIVEQGGARIAVTAVLGDSLHADLPDDVRLRPAAESLESVVRRMKEAGCDLRILLAHASLAESRALAEKFPEFDIVVTAGGAAEPPRQPERLPGGGLLVEVGHKAIYTGVIGWYGGEDADRFRYQLVSLDNRFDDSDNIVRLMALYQQQLAALWARGAESLGLRPITHPGGHAFVGSKVCGECHTTAYEIWAKTPHAHATESLVHPPERSEIARHFDPECVSCHVTGWEPQQFLPYASGFESLKRTPHLVGSGCENCHGPGSGHVAAERGEVDATPAVLKQLRQAMRLPLSRAQQTCIQCHDLDNSPDFHKPGAFEEYWRKIEHVGLD